MTDPIEETANFHPRTLFESLTGPRPDEVRMARALLLDRQRIDRRLAELGTFEEYAARLGDGATGEDYFEYWEKLMAIYRSERLADRVREAQDRKEAQKDFVVAALVVMVLVGILGFAAISGLAALGVL